MFVRLSGIKKGFSLVEIMIVIAIVGLLVAIVSASTIAARMKARDDRRLSDMKVIQIGLALYHDVYRAYPAGNGDASLLNGTLVTQKFLPVIPDDPDPAQNYEYRSDGRTYCLGVKLERAIPPDTSNCSSLNNNSQANYKASR